MREQERGEIPAEGETYVIRARAERYVEQTPSAPPAARRQERTSRARIAETRADMAETIDAIQERLNPQRVKDQVRESVHEFADEAREAVRDATIGRVEQMVTDAQDAVGDVGYGIVDRIRENPIPAAIAGIGLAWLMMGGSRREGRGFRPMRPMRRAYGYSALGHEFPRDIRPGPIPRGGRTDYVEGAREAAGDVRDRAGEAFEDAQERVGEWAGEAGHQAQRARGRFGDMVEENPIGLGALAIGLGAAVGLAVPRTDLEDEFMGAARDELMGQARQAVEQVGEQASRAVEQTK